MPGWDRLKRDFPAVSNRPAVPAAVLADELLLNNGGETHVSVDEVDLTEGKRLADLFFFGSWCRRRVVTLRFLAQRRGRWVVNVDFTPTPSFLKIAALTTDSEVLVPLLTCSKDFMPLAHVGATDETGRVFPLASVGESRKVVCMIMMSLAKQAGIWPDVIDKLGSLTDTDPRVSAGAIDAIEDRLALKQGEVWRSAHMAEVGPQTTRKGCHLVDFANAARLFNRSVLLMAAFPKETAEHKQHKIATFTYDAPIRLRRSLPERLGWSPLCVAPLTVFGGDADSYHVQLDPPSGVVVVDTRLLYSYTATQSLASAYGLPAYEFDDEPLPLNRRWPRRVLRSFGADRPFQSERARWPRPFFNAASAQGWRRLWGYVLGSSEPMPAHVHAGGLRLPRLIDGRDVVTLFHVYPDITGFAGLLVASAANVAYVLFLALALAWLPGGIHTGLEHAPEPVFLVGVLVAGLGSGLALYNREHILTDQVAKPWRGLYAIQIVAVVVSLGVLLLGIHQSFPPTGRVILKVVSVLALVTLLYLALISWWAWVAQRAGIRPVLQQGYFLRRIRFKWNRVPDVIHAKTLRAVNERRSQDAEGRRKTSRIMRRHAVRYFNEVRRRHLFNQGVPPSSRHDAQSRG